MARVTYSVVIERKAKKQLKQIPQKYQKKIKQTLMFLTVDPFAGKKLGGERKGEYSLRVWPYRIIYSIEKKKVTVYVLAIGHRQGIY